VRHWGLRFSASPCDGEWKEPLRDIIWRVFCEVGQKLKDELVAASTRLSDSATAGKKKVRVADRLQTEELNIEHQNAVSAFSRHVETCSVCSQPEK
jgi:hypothetical protein